MPSFHASDEEILALCSVLREHPGTSLEFAPSPADFEATVDLMIQMSLAAERPINWNVLLVDEARPERYRAELEAWDRADARGARVIALAIPHPMEFFISLANPFFFGALPGFRKVMAMPFEERRAELREPERRRAIERSAARAKDGPQGPYVDFARMRIEEVHCEANRPLRGRLVGDVAKERGQGALDCLLDIADADELKTTFVPVSVGSDDASWRARGEVLLDPRVVIGASDAPLRRKSPRVRTRKRQRTSLEASCPGITTSK